MPLNDHEQRILDEIERRLAEDDPERSSSRSVAPTCTRTSPVGIRLGRRSAFVAGLR